MRSATKLPLVAVMNFNSNYLAGLQSSGKLDEVVLHEMLHTLGFGTIWDAFTPSLLTGALTVDSAFAGAQALTASRNDNGGPSTWTSVPTENCVGAPNMSSCGEGTQDSHWRWAVFGNEIMTGWIGPAGSNPLSATTIASLGDLGYTVDLSQSDAFTIPFPSALRELESASPPIHLGDDVLHVRPVEVDEAAAP